MLPASLGANAGVDQALTSALRLNVSYSYRRGAHLLRGRNLNAPVAGVRPDPRFSNVVEVQSDADAAHACPQRRREHDAAGVEADCSSTRTTRFSSNETNTTGAFGLPANGDDLAAEWGTSAPEHRAGGMISMQPIRNLGVSAELPRAVRLAVQRHDRRRRQRRRRVQRSARRRRAQLGAHRRAVGHRPSAVVRDRVRSAPADRRTERRRSDGRDDRRRGRRWWHAGGFGGGATDKRFRVEFYASAQNVTNHDNYIGYSGVITSPFFGLPTNVLNPRKIEIGTRFGF